MKKTKRMYYRICEHCGANLDPGEKCDCRAGKTFPFKGKGKAWNAKALKPA